jgi:hypothetical protein
MSRVAILDYTGAVAAGIPLYYIVVTILLWGMTLVGQRIRIHVESMWINLKYESDLC